MLDPMEGVITIDFKKKERVSHGKWIAKKWKEGGFLPALAVAASLCCGKGGVGGSGSGLHLWAEICWIPWRVA